MFFLFRAKSNVNVGLALPEVILATKLTLNYINNYEVLRVLMQLYSPSFQTFSTPDCLLLSEKDNFRMGLGLCTPKNTVNDPSKSPHCFCFTLCPKMR